MTAVVREQQARRHYPLPLVEQPAAEVFDVARAAYQGRLVLYVGAGLSMASPSCGPRGSDVAERLRPFVAEILRLSIDEVPEKELESLALRVERDAAHRLEDLKRRAAEASEFRAMEPNYGHEAFALLLREGAVRGVSANWDRGVERAGRLLGIEIQSVADARDRLRLGQALPLFKVHGCVEHPHTLALTSTEVNRPQRWARDKVGDALAGGMVVFLGLGTVGLYVREPLDDLVELWSDDDVTIRVVDPGGLSSTWEDALGGHVAGVDVALDADRFLDDLLRAVVQEALSLTEDAVNRLQDGSRWTSTMLTGCRAIRERFGASPADGILRWWRAGVISTRDGEPFILDDAGRESLMTVALLAGEDGGPVIVSGIEGHLTLCTEQRYFEIMWRPGDSVADIERIARERIRRRRIARKMRLAQLEPSFAEVFDRLDPNPAFSELRARQDIMRNVNQVVPVVRDTKRGLEANPLIVFSEGQLNVVALSYFFGMALNAGDAMLPFLILDDPLQALDTIAVLGFGDLCRRIRDERQLIVTTHDRRYADILVRKLSPRDDGVRLIVYDLEGWTRQGPSVQKSSPAPAQIVPLVHRQAS